MLKKLFLDIEKSNFNKVLFLAVIFSIFASFMSSLRVFLLNDPEHFFINGNIFLSLVSLFLASYVYYEKNNKNSFIVKVLVFLAFFLSFIFLPNSPYLVTDSVHLSENLSYRGYDSVLFFSAALSGVMVYMVVVGVYFKKVSSYLKSKKNQFLKRSYKNMAYLFVLVTAFLNSFGIYLGRTYELLDNSGSRFNSGDLFARPKLLIEKVFDVVLHPLNYSEFPMLFAGFSIFLIFISIVSIYIGKRF